MRSLLVLIAVLIASPAFAITDSMIAFCKTQPNPVQCVRSLMAEERQAQREQAQIQADGLALFGSGNAMINGMNQHLNNMQLPVTPMPQVQPIPLPFPQAGR